MSVTSLQIKIVKTRPDAIIPEYKTDGSSGFDLCSVDTVILPPKGHGIVPLGFKVEIPQEGYEIQIRSRSGLALSDGLIVLNQPGTVDSDYRGEMGVILYNTSTSTKTIERGTRIAQGVLCPVVRARFVEVKELGTTGRGEGGFGSTGKS